MYKYFYSDEALCISVFNKTYTYAYKCIYICTYIYQRKQKKVMNLKEDRVVWECLRWIEEQRKWYDYHNLENKMII